MHIIGRKFGLLLSGALLLAVAGWTSLRIATAVTYRSRAQPACVALEQLKRDLPGDCDLWVNEEQNLSKATQAMERFTVSLDSEEKQRSSFALLRSSLASYAAAIESHRESTMCNTLAEAYRFRQMAATSKTFGDDYLHDAQRDLASGK